MAAAAGGTAATGLEWVVPSLQRSQPRVVPSPEACCTVLMQRLAPCRFGYGVSITASTASTLPFKASSWPARSRGIEGRTLAAHRDGAQAALGEIEAQGTQAGRAA